MSRAVDRLAAYYANLGLQPTCGPGEVPPPRVIAVLVTTGIDESLLEIALAKLGLTALLISVNNSVGAIAHLCRSTSASHIIYGPKFLSTVTEAAKILSDDKLSLQLIADKRFPLWGPGGVRDLGTKLLPFPARLTPEQETHRTCVILHSSGSTGFPKPVYITHYRLLANTAVSVPKVAFSALPVFHGFGHFAIFRCLYHGRTLTLFPPHLPITSANIVKAINTSPTPPLQHFAVPYVIKLLGETEEGVASMLKMEAVSFAGAALPDDLGDRLVAAGVPLISQYGATETGSLMTSNRDFKGDKAWNYVRNEGLIAEHLELVPQGGNMFEVVVKEGWPAKIMSNRDDGAYATKDLVYQHPEHPTWLKYLGRLDDTLTLTLGEKTNPVPIELDVRGNSPLVQECIVFGDGHPQVGALILPSEAGADLAKDKKAYINAIWPVIANANSRAPTHSRILPDMIEILPYGTEVPIATKMSILRPACYKKFADLIESVYERFERGTGAPKRDITEQREMETFLAETIRGALGDKAASGLESNTDLFAFGVDSLQATRVRNVLQKGLELGDNKLAQNIVYDYPSISQLAAHLLALKAGAGTLTGNSLERAHASMATMVKKWSAQVDRAAAAQGLAESTPTKEEVIVLTGATGFLGAHILDQLLRRDDVAEVICLARAKSHADATERVASSLRLRHRSVPSSRSRWRALAADVNRPDLGLSGSEYDALRTTTTCVIHNAWPVNFVLSIDSFDEHIGGAVHLLNLALRSPNKVKPSFFFSSSVATQLGRRDRDKIVVGEDFTDDPATASGMGYPQSKWVVEKVLQGAGDVARIGVFRIGQLAGDTEYGIWNETEAWPLMFKSANVVGSLPSLSSSERAQWLPVDLAGKSIADLVIATRSLTSAHAEVYHVLNPREANWDTILAGLKAGGLSFARVKSQAWLDALAKSDPDVQANPSFKLLGYYQKRLGGEERDPIEFEVTRTAKLSPTIARLKPVSAELVALWTRKWRESGFLAVE